MLLFDGALGLVLLALWLYCLLDAITSAADQVRNLPKLFWVVIVLILPEVGSIAWLIAGRPRGIVRPRSLPYKGNTGLPARPQRATRRVADRAPDDDPEFIRTIGERQDDVEGEHEALLDKWEADLRRREEELRRRAEPDTDGPGQTPA